MSCTSATTDATAPLTRGEKAREIAQANLYFLVSRAFSSPLEMRDEHPELLRQLAPELDAALQLPARALADAWDAALKDRETLSLAYARLFLGPFEILASPYESFYLEPDQRLMGPVSASVARMYAQAGLGPGKGPREAPDHVALEWEFMYYLTHQHVTTGEEAWSKWRRCFLSSHLDTWMPALSAAISKTGEHPFYDALSALLTVLSKPLVRE